MVIRLKDGGALFDVWTYDKLIAHAVQYSKGAVKRDYRTKEIVYGPDGRPEFSDKSPWKTAFISMAKKTILMSLRASAPLSVELMNAFEIENRTVKDSEISVEMDTAPAALVEAAPVPEDDYPTEAEILPPAPEEEVTQEAPRSDENGAV